MNSSIRTLLSPVLPLAFVLFLAGCGYTTAIKGTPVDEVAQLKVQRAKVAQRGADERIKLERMSTVTENKVFKIVDGLDEYRVGPLDVLEITSRIGETVKATQVVVNNRGLISYSFVDDLKVDGLTATEIDNLLTESLKGYLRKPRIDVLVKEFLSKEVSLLGEVASLRQASDGVALPSGKVALSGRTTLVELISKASGYTQSADLRNVRLIRDGKSYDINVFDIIEQGQHYLNVVVDDGDIIDIPELPEGGRKVYVMGEVGRQGVYDIREADTLLSALSRAGMFTDLAREENTLIVRPDPAGGEPLVMTANVEDLLEQADLSQNIRLQEGDLVYVPRELIGDINEWIATHTKLIDFLITYPRKVQSAYFYQEYLKLDTQKK